MSKNKGFNLKSYVSHFLPHHGCLSLGFAAEIMLDCFKTMIFIDIINHPTELIHIFALISSIVCNDVEMFVLRLRRNKLGILSIIKVSDSKRGTDTLATV